MSENCQQQDDQRQETEQPKSEKGTEEEWSMKSVIVGAVSVMSHIVLLF